jgi:hypothetical protein
VASLGEYKLNVTDPVGVYPPARVAVSCKVTAPIAPPAPATVLIVGLALLTVTVFVQVLFVSSVSV